MRIEMRIADIVDKMKEHPERIRFQEALAVACFYFGAPRITERRYFFSGSWQGSSLMDLQKGDKTAKPFQVRQLLSAISRYRDAER